MAQNILKFLWQSCILKFIWLFGVTFHHSVKSQNHQPSTTSSALCSSRLTITYAANAASQSQSEQLIYSKYIFFRKYLFFDSCIQEGIISCLWIYTLKKFWFLSKYYQLTFLYWISDPVTSKIHLVNPKQQVKKSRIRETLNISTDADHRTDIFLGGMVKKKEKQKEKKNVTHDMWHVTRDKWHMTRDTWHVTRDMCHMSHVTSHLSLQEQPQPQTLPFVTCPVGAQ